MRKYLWNLIDLDRYNPVNSILGAATIIFCGFALFYLKYSGLSKEARFVCVVILDILQYLVVYHWLAVKQHYATGLLAVNILVDIKNLLLRD